MSRIAFHLRKALWQAFEHDIVNTAKAAAYSGMLMLFPTLLVIATMLAQVEEGPTLVREMRGLFEQFLPPDAMDMVQSYLLSRHIYSTQLVLSATALGMFAGLGVMLSLMEGFRRAYHLPIEGWSFWGRRVRALLMVPIALIPLSVATLFIVFGHDIEHWMILNSGHGIRLIVVFFWRMVRWLISLAASTAVMMAIYHFGTLLWFPATLAFGWYVTRIADYSMFYGSFGAGIATLVWLYITAFSVLLGAEINGELYRERQISHR